MGALLVLAIAFGVTVSILKAPSNSEGDSNLCLTESCTSAAAFILGNVDRSIDPCDDFYNFTCGAWAQKTVIPTGMWVDPGVCVYMYSCNSITKCVLISCVLDIRVR